uniref:ACD n=1 Tax=Dunaliella tertiolecta TaxID=3047 RepID=A0A2U8JGM2_DUNTE|nr:ACD [Dunaliella tertiolecta]
MQSATSNGVGLNVSSLQEYLQRQLPTLFTTQLGGTQRQPPGLHVRQFSHGQSNPTFLITLMGTDDKFVLRKKPAGRILASAHAVEREYAVLDALSKHHSGVPVPRPLLLCNDKSVIGTPFYLMEFIEGAVYVDPNMPEAAPDTRRDVYQQMVRCLAALHNAPVRELGLQNFGDPQGYCARRLKRWTQQYNASVAEPMPEVLRLVEWLKDHVPPEDLNPERPSICHGDFRLDNLMFAPSASGRPVLHAVLDWELSTVGNRWADVAYNCLPYHLPRAGILQCLNMPLAPGIPTEQEYVQTYCEAAGCMPPSPTAWSFYMALSLFRLLAILAGVQARAKQGNASSARAAMLASDAVLQALAEAAFRAAGLQDPTSSSSSSSSNGVPQPKLAPPSYSTSIAVAPQPTAANATHGGQGVQGGSDVVGLPSARVQELRARVLAFVEEHVLPAEEVLEAHACGADRWTIHPRMEEMKAMAKAAGLWNLWLPGSLAATIQHMRDACSNSVERDVLLGAGLNNLEYAHVCEVMGRSVWAPEVFNCGAPDTGNMEVLAKYASREQQQRWLLPLLQGHIRSCFAMTEKLVASSDATNIQSSIRREGDSYVLNGVKWWTSGACDPRCAVAIFMGKTDPTAPMHLQQSMVLVPMDTPGVQILRPLLVFGYDDAPHGHAEVAFKNVRVPASNIILGEGRGFEIAQGRLGPGRLHHCMRLIGMAERAIATMTQRSLQRHVFGGKLARQGAFQASLANCRIQLDAARLMVLAAAPHLDRSGNKAARGTIAAAKVVAPNAAQLIIDAAIQAHGGAGVSQDTVLARLWTAARTLRIADGPDEVHLTTIAKLEIARASKL